MAAAIKCAYKAICAAPCPVSLWRAGMRVYLFHCAFLSLLMRFFYLFYCAFFVPFIALFYLANILGSTVEALLRRSVFISVLIFSIKFFVILIDTFFFSHKQPNYGNKNKFSVLDTKKKSCPEKNY